MEKDKILLRSILCGGLLLGQAKKEVVPRRFCGGKDGDGHLFQDCTFLPSCMLGISLNLHPFCLWIAVMLWHGWLPGLSAAGDRQIFGTAFGCLSC